MTDKQVLKVQPRGRWFVLEGPKGAGKTATQSMIGKANGASVALAAEPSGMATRINARRLAADPTVSTRAVFEAICTDRMAHMKLVRQTLAEGRHVLQSRSYMSSGVLQGALSPSDSGFTMSRILETQMDAFGCPDAVLWFDNPEHSPQELAVLLMERIGGRASAAVHDPSGQSDSALRRSKQDDGVGQHPQILNLERQIDAYRLCRARFTDMSRRWCTFRSLTPTQNVVVDCLGDLKAVCSQVVAVMRGLGME